ncbi:hypothetical protein MATL_G00122940 [Megalops atlanticus]|uniref:Uncharacterized protein n=1 Tax=Megalops atlanticus TaxID=7932 RepID=A0A9D3Q197_MEGAT|nr:hypothetical protein MATL_G00122940 [Megalops atlanticus]
MTVASSESAVRRFWLVGETSAVPKTFLTVLYRITGGLRELSRRCQPREKRQQLRPHSYWWMKTHPGRWRLTECELEKKTS